MKHAPVFTVTAHYVVYVLAGIAVAIWSYVEMPVLWLSLCIFVGWIAGLLALEFGGGAVEQDDDSL